MYEVDVTVSVATVHYALGGSLVAVKEGSALRYVHSDHLGSSSVSTDTAGAEVGDQTYLPYGDERSSSGTLGTERQFTGQRFDGGSGLYFYNARYYDANIGRFISADTIVPGLGNPQAWNRYSYVLNNPLRYTDVTGNCHGTVSTWNTGPFNPFVGGCRGLHDVVAAVVKVADEIVENVAPEANRAAETYGEAILANTERMIDDTEADFEAYANLFDKTADAMESDAGNFTDAISAGDVALEAAAVISTRKPRAALPAAAIIFIAISLGPDAAAPYLRDLGEFFDDNADRAGDLQDEYFSHNPSDFQYETEDHFP